MSIHRAAASDRRIPASLADILSARLDQLGPAKFVAQVVAVIGDQASLTLLTMVSGIPEELLQSRLDRLIKAGLLQQSGLAHDPSYCFVHALVRDAAYEALLKSRRRELHHRTATILSDKFSALAAKSPELLAHHWQHAGQLHAAIAAWRQAGDNFLTGRAFREAQQAYGAALSILTNLPSSADRDAAELHVQAALAQVLRITEGYSAPLTVVATTRARTLCEHNGDIVQQLVQAVGAWAAASSGGDYSAAKRIAEQVLGLAIAHGSEASLAQAYMI